MTERFSAQGSPELWLASSIETLEDLGFEHIYFEPGEHEVSGVKNGKFSIEVLPDNDKTLLVIQADSQEDIDNYKKVVARVLGQFRKLPEENIYLKLSTPVGVSEEELAIYPDTTISETTVSQPIETEDINQPVNTTDSNTTAVAKPEWYKSTWFIFLISILCPPLGIYLMWKFKLFYPKDRKIFTTFFGIYTILWLWLLYTLFFYRSYTEVIPESVENSGSQIDQINAYWGTDSVTNYVSQMPDLINTFDNLEVNGELGSDYGNQTAEEVFSQVQALSEGVLGISPLSDTNAAYTLQLKVNEAAQAFLTAIQGLRDAIASGDINRINEATSAWNAAENTYYEINYLYQNAIQMATENANAQGGQETLEIEESSQEV